MNYFLFEMYQLANNADNYILNRKTSLVNGNI